MQPAKTAANPTHCRATVSTQLELQVARQRSRLAQIDRTQRGTRIFAAFLEQKAGYAGGRQTPAIEHGEGAVGRGLR